MIEVRAVLTPETLKLLLARQELAERMMGYHIHISRLAGEIIEEHLINCSKKQNGGG